MARQTLLRGLAEQNPGKLRSEFVKGDPSGFLVWLGDDPEPLLLFGREVEAWVAGFRARALFSDPPGQLPTMEMIAGHRFN